jgi:HPt (histidine-containing phosphotransfer) domain-containing protein
MQTAQSKTEASKSAAKTVSRAALIQMADSIERAAIEALPSRTILGQAAKTVAELDQAAAIRRAADVQSIQARRAMLRLAGVQA